MSQIAGKVFASLYFSTDQLKHVTVYQGILKSTITQIEKAQINDRLRVSNISWKFCIPTIFLISNIFISNAKMKSAKKSSNC